jgi:hypothetical protein
MFVFSVSHCPVQVQAMQRTDPPSRESYQMSKRLIMSEKYFWNQNRSRDPTHITELRNNMFRLLIIILRTNNEPGSSVSIVSGYGLDDRAIEVRSLAEAIRFFL